MNLLFKQYVLRFEVTVNKTSLVQQRQSVQQLLCKHTNQGCAKAPELILFDELVQVDTEEFENKAKMLPMDEGVLQTKNMVIVVFVELRVEL